MYMWVHFYETPCICKEMGLVLNIVKVAVYYAPLFIHLSKLNELSLSCHRRFLTCFVSTGLSIFVCHLLAKSTYEEVAV